LVAHDSPAALGKEKELVADFYAIAAAVAEAAAYPHLTVFYKNRPFEAGGDAGPCFALVAHELPQGQDIDPAYPYPAFAFVQYAFLG
jgi:hypothetical protein